MKYRDKWKHIQPDFIAHNLNEAVEWILDSHFKILMPQLDESKMADYIDTQDNIFTRTNRIDS